MHPKSTKVERTCEQCAAVFLAAPSMVAKGAARFCSVPCANEAKKAPRIERTCPACGKSFSILPCIARVGRGVYCSSTCADNTRKERVTRVERVERACMTCGRMFSARPKQIANGMRHCSIECSNVAKRRGTADHFWSKVAIAGDDECWLWQAGSFSDGYGAYRFRGTLWKASRVAWTITNGDIPNGLWVLHRCDVPACCNPAHLFTGTPADNMQDRDAKGRTSRISGSERWSSKLTESDVITIRERYAAGGVTYYVLADDYGVTFQNIWHIVHRKTWAHV